MLKMIKFSLLTLSLLTPLALDPLISQLTLTETHAASAQPDGKAKPELIQATALYTLYDGSLGTTPDQQGFIYLALAFAATQTLTTGGTILNTMPITNEQAGYFNRPAQTPLLDRTLGYTVNFTIRVISETHTGSDRNSDGIDDRAGFSVIVLSNDSKGIELGFWENQIWAQEDGVSQPPLFTHAEGITFTTTTASIPYHLAILSNTYTLSTSGVPILTGSLRDYTAFGGFPYTSANFIFLGDNTASARASTKLSVVSVNTAVTSTITTANYLPVILREN
jgi:hypothetical protein